MGELVRLEGVRLEFHLRRSLFRTVPLRALDGASISLGKAETLGLIGESGSGKTTLGRVSLRLLRPTGGRVLFDSRDITDLDEADLKWFRRRAQAVFQDPYSSINPYMSVQEIVEEPLRIHGVGEGSGWTEAVHKALTDVRLTPAEEFASKYPHMLSGGQRQRVGMARAMVMRPDFVVADEPVSMIDASSRAEILYLLRDLQRTYGVAFLYITHDMATARYFSDRMAVMYLGRVVELGPSREVISGPLHPYTQGLIEAVPEPDPSNRFKERKTVPGEPGSPLQIPNGCRFHPRCPFMMAGKCDVIDPHLGEVRPGHFVACHLY